MAHESESSGFHTLTTKGLKALSHPVRRRIADVLSAGPARAADLARDLDLPANQMSFHLRTLAEAELIVEAPEAARDRRDRVWKARPEALRVIDPAAQLDAAQLAAVDVFLANEVADHTARVHRSMTWLSEAAAAGGQDGGEPEFRADWTNSTLRLTGEEARDLLHKLRQVVEDVRAEQGANNHRSDDELSLWRLSIFATRDDV